MRCEKIGNMRDEDWNLDELFECRAKLYWHKKYKGSLTVGETPENPNLICTLTFHHTKACSKLKTRVERTGTLKPVLISYASKNSKILNYKGFEQ